MLSREETIKAFGIQWGYTTAFWGPVICRERRIENRRSVV